MDEEVGVVDGVDYGADVCGGRTRGEGTHRGRNAVRHHTARRENWTQWRSFGSCTRWRASSGVEPAAERAAVRRSPARRWSQGCRQLDGDRARCLQTRSVRGPFVRVLLEAVRSGANRVLGPRRFRDVDEATRLLVEAVCDKYLEHLPIERQAVRFARAGVDVAPQTLGRVCPRRSISSRRSRFRSRSRRARRLEMTRPLRHASRAARRQAGHRAAEEPTW